MLVTSPNREWSLELSEGPCECRLPVHRVHFANPSARPWLDVRVLESFLPNLQRPASVEVLSKLPLTLSFRLSQQPA
jgi:hypothetical protein